jgi:hypothetical protein
MEQTMTRYLILSEISIWLTLAIAVVVAIVATTPEAHARMHCYIIDGKMICCTTAGNLTTCQ